MTTSRMLDGSEPLPHVYPQTMESIEARIRAAEGLAAADQDDFGICRPSERSERWATRVVFLIGMATLVCIWIGLAP